MDLYLLTDEETVARISDMFPRALTSYFLCLHSCDEQGRATFYRDKIINDHLKSWTKFKNDVRALASMMILNFIDDQDSITIQVHAANQDDSYDDCVLC